VVIRKDPFYGRKIRKSTVNLAPLLSAITGDPATYQSNNVGNPLPGTRLIDAEKAEAGIQVLDALGLQETIENGIQHEAGDIGIHIFPQFSFLVGIVD
jgi:hypothetical protein